MSQPAIRSFGAGRFFGINNVTSPTPMRAITPQDQSIDFKRAIKALSGEKQLPAEIAVGEMTVTGKVTMGGLNARLFADLIFGDGSSTGQILEADGEAATIPSVSTYTVTVVNSTHFTTDLGVQYAAGKIPFVCVASAPAVGQYSYNATTGVYTFAAADAGKNINISYLYTNTMAGETITLSNQLQGPTGNFTAVMAFIFGANQNILTLNNALASDAGLATKMSDYTKPTFGFECATDTNDNLGTFSFAQAA